MHITYFVYHSIFAPKIQSYFRISFFVCLRRSFQYICWSACEARPITHYFKEEWVCGIAGVFWFVFKVFKTP